jgi:hypothetical protein
MIKEEDIVYEVGDFWVLASKYGYEVRRNIRWASDSDYTFPKTADGLSLAKTYADYKARS